MTIFIGSVAVGYLDNHTFTHFCCGIITVAIDIIIAIFVDSF